MNPQDGVDWALARLAEDLSSTSDAGVRRNARLFARAELLRQRFRGRRHASYGRLFDSLAKFGGGSLLTALVSLMLGGRYGTPTLLLAVVALMSFVGGAISTMYNDLRAAAADYAAERIEAVLKETER